MNGCTVCTDVAWEVVWPTIWDWENTSGHCPDLEIQAGRSKKPVVNRWPDSGKQLSLFDAPEEVSRPDEGDRSLVYHTCLVVVPASLIHNWRNELRKFAPQLTVTIYAGTNRIDLRSYLQRSDVVLITYHTLRNDIDILSRLTFGIVVADEAQMLKNPGSQLHQAMMRIQGRCFGLCRVHR